MPIGCPAAPASLREASTLIVLDFDGGPSLLEPGAVMSGLEPADLPIGGVAGPPMAGDESDAFKEAVRLRVEEILCGLDPVDMRVIIASADDYPSATRVYLTIDSPPNDGLQVGQADYDPCNLHADDAAIIWGGKLAAVAGTGWTRAHWINILANVSAHEIGHTLGFAHPDDIGMTIDAATKDRELMVSSHTISSLAGEQEFLYSQTTCSSAGSPGGVNYTVVNAIEEPPPRMLTRARMSPAHQAPGVVHDFLAD